MKWYDDGLCLEMHSDIFYPPPFKEERDLPESAYYRVGKLVCQNCPIQQDCYLYGLAEDYGLWGGATPKERLTGDVVPTKTFLPKEKLHLIPRRAPDEPLDIIQLTADLKPHLKRRPRKKD